MKSLQVLMVQKGSIVFKDKYLDVRNWSSDDQKAFLDDLLSIQNILRSSNSKGFVNDLALWKQPLMDILVSRYINIKSDISLENLSELDIIKIKSSLLSSHEILVLSVWFNNMIYLNLYSLTIDLLSSISEKQSSYDDVLTDILYLSKEFLGCIRGPIRESMRQRGITMEENVSVGFDTEYKSLVKKNTNLLLSAQWAVSTKILLKVPLIEDYKLCGMNTQTGIVYPISSFWYKSTKINFVLMEQDINRFIKSVRFSKYGDTDKSVQMLVDGLIRRGYPNLEKNGYILFSFPRSSIKTFIKTKGLETLDFSSVLTIALNLSKSDVSKGSEMVLNLLKEIYKDWNLTNAELVERCSNLENLINVNNLSEDRLPDDDIKIQEPLTDTLNKKYRRSNLCSFTSGKIAFTIIKNLYLIGHLTSADLCMLRDFDEIKKNFDIVNKSFVTIRRGLFMFDHNVHVRDTMLLAPGGKKSLASIGGMYDLKYNKLELEAHEIENMDVLKVTNYKKFVDYAIKDSVITLVHACNMEDFGFRIGYKGVPLTLSGLSSNYLKSYWLKNDYRGYQVSPDYLLGNTGKSITPKGLFATGDVGLVTPYFISSYKGGRNESFMYGIDRSTKWFDYDLISAYTTAMSLLGNPDYSRLRILSPEALESLSARDLIYSYTIIKGSFTFPLEVKYPSIACYIDETSSVYPRSGTCCITGPEYLAARNAGCQFIVTECYTIPFEVAKDEFGADLLDKEGNVTFVNHPFKNVIKDLLGNRVQHPKGSINNLMYKELGNSLYGLVVRGINNKMKFDVKSNKTIRMEGNELSNPILASYITGYVRSLLGEILNEIDLLKGKVVSVTTDGFITDLENLESRLLSLGSSRVPLLREYKVSRSILSINNDSTALEVKHEGIGIISWTVRGQFSSNASIKATTGFQVRNLLPSDIETLLLDSLRSPSKSIDYVHFTLRSASEIYKKGGHVVSKYRDQIFRCHYDNRRLIIDEGLPSLLDKDVLYDSVPLNNITECLILRQYSNLSKNKVYQKNTSSKGMNDYRSSLEIGVRSWIVSILKSGLYGSYNDIIDYLKSFEKTSFLKINRKITPSYISMVKSRLDILKSLRRVPRTFETVEFLKYVNLSNPNFTGENWFSS